MGNTTGPRKGDRVYLHSRASEGKVSAGYVDVIKRSEGEMRVRFDPADDGQTGGCDFKWYSYEELWFEGNRSGGFWREDNKYV